MERNWNRLFLGLLFLILIAVPTGVLAQNFLGNGTVSNIQPTTLLGNSQAISFAISGAPSSGQSWSIPCPYTLTFPIDYAGSPPDGNARVSCGTSPSVTETYKLSMAGTQVGTVALTSSCSSTSGTTGTGVTFKSTNSSGTPDGLAKTCAVGQRLSLIAPTSGGAASLIGTPGTGSGNTTTLALTTPAGSQSGDVLIACIGNYVSGGPATTIPTGFAYITGSSTTSCQAGDPGGGTICIYSNILSAAGSSSYTWTWAATGSYESGVLMDYRGLNTASLVDTAAIGAQGTVSSSTTISVPFGTTTASDLLLSCAGTYPSTGWSTAPNISGTALTQVSLIPASAGNNVMTWVGSVSEASGASGTVTGTLTTGGNTGTINMPLKIGAGSSTLSEADLGFTLVGHISALP